ncbi:acetyl-CoA C-acyltransferase FadI [Algiphilus sp. NNCM1]|uniref:acetyl-CoA C-acyltransferase FadI n=1 Tax=Algiphilus sp. TaxID=1872431 RepID=UPI001CA73DEB|nr:acetyl-CoA C-acyltransferase FadI [Algiphilus sp.]MBY8967042.1 acetyl-CoA C-acyltransferase FadI [Algiphilus acroporae]MCI5104321.1 acetyl-CoA C-acyltransferase FadI [Algiphilus sp.]
MSKRLTLSGPRGRVAIVAGLRTPFARMGTHFRDINAVDLGAMLVSEMVARSELSKSEIDQVVFGMTVMMPSAPFIGREIALACGMPDVDAYSVTRACATSFQTAANAAESILAGTADVVVAGGVDSTSHPPITISKKLTQVLRDAQSAKTLQQRLKLFSSLRPKDLLPVPPSITEYSVGETMGQSAEKMAKKWGVTREEQDDIAHASHSNAANAWAQGWMDDQVMTAFIPPKSTPVHEDNLVRKDSKREGYGKLKPVFDKQYGTVTAGNASPLTDGAAGMILMSEEKAKALGYKPLGYIRGYHFAAKTPKDDLLMGPVLAAPVALDRAGVTLKDMDLVDMHEAFAAQIACNLKGLASKKYFEEMMGRSQPVGEVDRSKLNVVGGSIAYGHPFGATGARVIVQTLNELQRRGGGLALTTACAAGGIGAAMVLETE